MSFLTNGACTSHDPGWRVFPGLGPIRRSTRMVIGRDWARIGLQAVTGPVPRLPVAQRRPIIVAADDQSVLPDLR